MPYSQPSDVRQAALPSNDGTQPLTPSYTAADLPDSQLVDAIAEADSLIDAYIGGSYGADDTIPPVVKYWSRDIALYYATLTFRKSKDFSADDPIRLRYTTAINALAGGAGKNIGGIMPIPPPDIPMGEGITVQNILPKEWGVSWSRPPVEW